ncbi:blood vessel epicardial substance-like isoform X2 [Dreissena polymorpha]|uniref:POPDC1-3 domain-containing protein n=1 Tax=Dreissena polymorpha TaxID=45954 RepID=A0A9D4CL04_DREPO|nr:blood vessel epicardial substance-like isoform X2 [Dreissena polymorpha]KAH3727308.1 hypothetical protein DPMN_053238 [Dreissena polymorpha]
MLNITAPVVEDAHFANDSLISTSWPTIALGCSSWKPPHHVLFQIANGVLFVGLLCPNVKYGLLALHSQFVFGFMLLSVWSWVILCAPDFFSWNFAFMLVNVVQTFMLMYHLKPIKFEEDMEELYTAVFEPMNVSRRLFKRLTDKNFCVVSRLYDGDAYAIQGLTKTDRLGILLSGTMNVYSHQNLLHLVQPFEFIDSPEFESSVTGDEKFQVSVYAVCTCQFVYWSRQSLEYLLLKEPYLATILNTILGRDITNKLYALSERAQETEADTSLSTHQGSSPKVHCRNGDLRRTLAQLSTHSSVVGTERQALGKDHCPLEEHEDVNASGLEEIETLLSLKDKQYNQSVSTPACVSIGFNQSRGSNVMSHGERVCFDIENDD